MSRSSIDNKIALDLFRGIRIYSETLSISRTQRGEGLITSSSLLSARGRRNLLQRFLPTLGQGLTTRLPILFCPSFSVRTHLLS